MREQLKQARSHICLLGGSNSLISTGIRAGLSTYANVMNLALGATTSTQNIYELTRAHDRMMSDIDCIVTESNINDAHAIHTAGLPADVVRENISKLYRELALTGKFTVALLLPIRQYLNSSPPADLAAQVKQYHVEAAKRYGISTIDVDLALAEYTISHEWVRYIMPDQFHPLGTFMYELGLNLGQYLRGMALVPLKTQFKANYKVISAGEMGGELRTKSNAGFTRQVVDVNESVALSIKNGVCVGISTWSDGPSELILTGDGYGVVKQFRDLFSFNEFGKPVFGRITLQSNRGTSDGCTERSINVHPQEKDFHPVSIVGFLVENENHSEPSECRESMVLDHLIPDATIHIKSVLHVLHNMERAERRRVLQEHKKSKSRSILSFIDRFKK